MSEAALRRVGQPRARPLRLASDARLVRIAVRGEQRAFGAIFQRYHQDLYRYCRAILGSEEEAADAIQNTMLKVMRALPGETREIALRPWLFRIAHNEAVALLRQRPQSAELSEEEPAGSASLPEARAETRQRLRQLLGDLRSLPERQRGALVMRELNGMDYAAIGAVFGTSADGARQTIYEARLALRETSEGREMECEQARKAISAGDGRVLRGRRLRAHLRICEDCRGFRTGIRERRADLAALAPPMPALAAAGLLQNILGSGHAGGGSGGLLGSLSGGGKVIAGSTALKSAAAVVATATVAVGAGDVTGVINPPLIGKSSQSASISAGSGTTTQPASAGTSGVGRHSSTPKSAGPGVRVHQGRHGGQPKNQSHHAGSKAKANAAGLSHPHGPAAGATGHSDFGKSHAPADLPAPAQNHPSAPASSAKTSDPRPAKLLPKPPPATSHPPLVPVPPPTPSHRGTSNAP
jgi:RNA polymerase sigma factor (sigma-70 family)